MLWNYCSRNERFVLDLFNEYSCGVFMLKVLELIRKQCSSVVQMLGISVSSSMSSLLLPRLQQRPSVHVTVRAGLKTIICNSLPVPDSSMYVSVHSLDVPDSSMYDSVHSLHVSDSSMYGSVHSLPVSDSSMYVSVLLMKSDVLGLKAQLSQATVNTT